MTNITLNTTTRKCTTDKYFLGYEGENNINKLVFKFEDGFRDGLGILNIKRGEETGYLDLTKVNNTYELEVKSALLSKIGEIVFQLSINQPDGTVIKYDTFTMVVKDAIDADSEMPEDYPNWVDMANAKLAEVDEAISDVETAIQNANGVADTLLQARQNGEFDGRDGEDGTDGVSPVVTTQQTSTGSTITITDAVGTHTATLSNGRDGTDGIDGISSEVSIKTNTETEYVLTITDKNGSFDTPNLKGTNAENGILSETDPIYLSEKSTLALKTEIPTKVSDLNNDSGYITSYTETDPTVPNHVKNITQANINSWNNKSDFSGSYDDLTNKPTIPSTEGLVTTQQLIQGLAAKQDVLTAGSNITIENGVISSTASGGGGLAELPIATADTLGGIKVGEGLEITEEGVLSTLSSRGEATPREFGCFSIGTPSETTAGSEIPITTVSSNMALAGNKLTLKANKSYLIKISCRHVAFSGASGTLSIKLCKNDGSEVKRLCNFYPMNVSSATYGGSAEYVLTFEEDTEVHLAVQVWGAINTYNDLLFTIQEVESVGGSGSGSSYKEVDLISEPSLYTQGGTSGTTIGQDLTLLDDITNYDEIVFNIGASDSNKVINSHPENFKVLVSNVVYNSTTTNTFDGSRFTLSLLAVDRRLGCWFKDSKTLYVYNTYTLSTFNAVAYFRINSIKGIKY